MNYLERYRHLVDDWDAFMAAVERPLPNTIWTNHDKITPAELTKLLPVSVNAISWYPGGLRLPDEFQPGLHWIYLAGLCHAQEEVSLLPVHLLDPQPGERVLDLCAAPGNKTAQLGLRVGESGTVVANDRSAGRMRAARQNLERLGLTNVTTITADGANLPRAIGSFDRVLVDAPCSCEGTCRKEPSALKHASPGTSLKMARSQKALLRKGVQLCRPGGRIVYATCTFAPEENELVVDAILREAGPHRLRLIPAMVPGFAGSPGITHWHEQSLHESLGLTMRVWPHQNDTGGFFVAVLEKSSEALPLNVTPPEPTALPAEREPWLELVGERFGFTPEYFGDYEIFRWSRKRLYLLPRSHQPPAAPQPDALGIHFMNVDGKYPKLTTAAAMRFGHLATRNFVGLEPDQMVDFVSRQPVTLAAAQMAPCTGTGYVLVRYQGFTLGAGVFRQHLDLLESLYPKGWTRANVVA